MPSHFLMLRCWLVSPKVPFFTPKDETPNDQPHAFLIARFKPVIAV